MFIVRSWIFQLEYLYPKSVCLSEVVGEDVIIKRLFEAELTSPSKTEPSGEPTFHAAAFCMYLAEVQPSSLRFML